MPYPYASGLFYPCTVQAAIDGLAKNRSIFGKKREGPSRPLLARRRDGGAKKTSATDFAAGRVGSPDVIHFDAIQWTCTFPAPDVGPSPTQERAHRFVWSHLLVTISEIAQAIQIVGEQLSIARQNVSTTESALERPNYVVSLTRFVDVFVPLPLKLT